MEVFHHKPTILGIPITSMEYLHIFKVLFPHQAVSDGPEAFFLHDKFGFAAAQQARYHLVMTNIAMENPL